MKTDEEIVRAVNDLISALEVRVMQLHNPRTSECNNVKRALGQLKAAKAAFLVSVLDKKGLDGSQKTTR